MMAPSLVLEGGRPRLVVGSAGSIRLRGAILQIVVNVVDHGLSARGGDASPARPPRGGRPPARGRHRRQTAADRLEDAGYAVNRWAGRNLYFGGASAVAVRADGALEAAGDPRRGGAGVVVAA